MQSWKTLVPLALIVGVAPVFAGDSGGKEGPEIPGLRARLRVVSYHNPPGKPVWVVFSIENTTEEAITLTVPGAEPEIPAPEVGLPLSHVFSGGATSGLTLATGSGQHWDTLSGHRTPKQAPILMVAPRSIVGTMLDLRKYFPVLRGAGKYQLTWKPYAGGTVSDTVVINVEPLKQALVTTDDGMMTLRFFYDDAPKTVANFIELAQSKFYNGKLFHRIEPGYLIQGGDPRGDGTGIRLDGKRIPAEFNHHPHQKGSVSMALLADDPDSASCQFFICNTRQKEWDGKYTVFAQLVGEESFETLDRLMATKADEFGRPQRSLFIRSIRIMSAPSETYHDTP